MLQFFLSKHLMSYESEISICFENEIFTMALSIDLFVFPSRNFFLKPWRADIVHKCHVLHF